MKPADIKALFRIHTNKSHIAKHLDINLAQKHWNLDTAVSY